MFTLQPIPTPTPGQALSQVNQAVERISNSLDIATQQGAIGVMLLLGVVAVILSLTWLLRTYISRNKKDNVGIYAQMLIALQKSLENAEQERRETVELLNKQARETEARYIKFGTGFSEALKYWADQIKTQSAINAQVGETLEALSIHEDVQDGKIKAIHQGIESIRQALTILSGKIEMLTAEHVTIFDNATKEMKTVAAAVNQTLALLDKKRGDTKPIPVVTPDMLNGAQAAPEASSPPAL